MPNIKNLGNTISKYRFIFFLVSMQVLFLMLFFRNLFFTFIILVVSAVIQYLSVRGDIKVDLGHVFFFSIMIARNEGILIAISYMIIAGLLPQIMEGDIDEILLVKYFIYLFFVIIAFFLKGFNAIIVGLIMNVLAHGLVAFLSIELFDADILEIIQNIGLPIILNFVYFLTFTGLVDKLI